MSTITDVRRQCGQTQCPPQNVQTGEDQTVSYNPGLTNAVHACFEITEPQSAVPGSIYVNVVDSSNRIRVTLWINIRDTIRDLKQAYLRMTQASVGTLNLVLNGILVYDYQTLAELHVIKGATFIIFHRCNGG